MAKRILHGGFERTDNELNNSFYRELVRDVPEGGTVLLTYFASKGEELHETFMAQSDRIRRITDKNLRFLLATEADFIEQIRESDVVHFRGGHTPKLLATLAQYSDLKSELSEKILSGSSAGAYALAAYGPGHSEEGIRKGLGIVPVRVVCHFESPELPPDPDSYAELLTLAPELELVQLRDYEWRIF